MTVDLQRLRELAEKATPGPWYIKRCHYAASEDEACGIATEPGISGGTYGGICSSDNLDECSHMMTRADAFFIAAANPQAVIALITENETMRTMLAESRREHDRNDGFECVTNLSAVEPCDCGALEWNAKLDAMGI